MNEELKIIIKAVTSDAKKKIDDVKKKLDDTKKSGEKSGKSIAQAMQSIKKGAMIAVGAITAVTTALIAFGKSTLEAQKEISKLEAAFIASGSGAKQARKTYTDLFRFMGDSGAATEAAQSLAALTTNQKDLNQWTKILQGTFATFGTTLPVESLAEAINHTAQLGEVQGVAADAFEWKGITVEEVNNKLANMVTLEERELFLRSTLNSMYGEAANVYEANNQALLAHNESQARLTIALAQAGNAVMPLLTAFNNLSAALLTTLKPALEIVSQVIAILVGWIVTAVQWISAFFSFLTGKGSSAADNTKKIADNTSKIGNGFKGATSGVGGLNKALGGATKAAKELKKQTMGFDELNVISSPTEASGASGGGGGAGGGASIPGVSALADLEMPNFDDVKKSLEDARGKAEAILALVGAIGVAFALWKIADLINDVGSLKEALKTIGGKMQTIGGIALIVAGAILLIKGYTDAWVNGLDWGNFAAILAGIGLTVGGLALAFGTVAAGVGMVAGGIAILVLGIKDLVENGFSMQGMLAVVAGVILTCVGAVLAFNAALLANPITWVVIAIAALVAALVVCIVYWDDVKAAAVNAWNKTKEIWEKVAKWFSEKVTQPIAKFFSGLWDKTKEIFKNTKEWFSEKFNSAWEGVKGIWEGVSNWFKLEVWDKIANTFGNVKEWFRDKFSAAWEAIKGVFSNFGSFFSGLWNTIKTTFSTLGTKIGDAIGKAVKSGINGIITMIENTLNRGIELINGAISIINKLPGVNVSRITKLSLPRLAKGGVVDSATIAMIGEAGKEAVVPLENNTQWMDRLADRIASRNNNPTKVILKVGEKELGWATIGAINGITEQTGGLQLVL